MRAGGLALYYIPMDDCHMSEYVGEHFKCIRFMSGFTGSAASMVVTCDGAYLFTDGRYYIQAAKELEGSGVQLMKSGMPGVPEPAELIAGLVKDKDTIGFDGNVVSASFALSLSEKLGSGVKFSCEKDLVGQIWKDRPAQRFTEIWEFEEQYAGESTSSKIAGVRAGLEKNLESPEDDYLYIVSSLDDIAWIFNIRADDIPCNPVPFAYGIITRDMAFVYTGGSFREGLAQKLEESGVIAGRYGARCTCMEVPEETVVLMDPDSTGYSIFRYYESRGYTIINIKNPSLFLKGIKNETEIKNTKAAYIKDSIVLIKFMKWIKDLAAKTKPGEVITENGKPVTEITVNEMLLKLRSQNGDFFEPSFDTIAAYGPNAAMMHYEAVPESFSPLKAEGMLLVDSGGQYLGATTDITRTFVLGEITADEKKSFTLTAMSMLRLMNTKFISGCTGENLDIIARAPMWANGLDYKCGTGHGVGCCLNVHEGPHRIKWKITDGRKAVLAPGMFVTDEPGVYKEGRYGIRLENELVVSGYMETGDGKFLCFENMTFIPLDRDGIDEQYMNDEDRRLFWEYNRQIWEKVSPYLDEETKQWLKKMLIADEQEKDY